MKFISLLLFLVGIVIAMLGAGIDFILPGTSPGLNLPQMLVIAGGILLVLSAIKLWRAGVPKWSGRGAVKNGAAVIVITLVTLGVLEIVLTIIGTPTFYPQPVSDRLLEMVPWWICDEAGCRYDYNAIVAACETGELDGRHCNVNRQGYGDSKDFVVDASLDQRQRLLILGDSFTQGFSADVGYSYVETIERKLPDIVVWNAGIGGTGTNQALRTFARLGPLFKPQLTILGFFVNDFKDNLYPLDSKMRFVNDDGVVEVVRYYILDRGGNPVRLQMTPTLLEYARAGKLPTPNELEQLAGNTRIGSILLQLKERIDRLFVPRDLIFSLEIERTREYLRLLRQQVAEQDSLLLVLMIDFRKDRTAPKNGIETAIELLHELKIPYMDTTNWIDTPGDFAEFPNVHWNNVGHQKVGVLLSECIEAYMSSADFADCHHVIVP